MTFKPWEDIKAEIDATLKYAADCPGLMLAVGNHIPYNVPLEMTDKYTDYLKANWNR